MRGIDNSLWTIKPLDELPTVATMTRASVCVVDDPSGIASLASYIVHGPVAGEYLYIGRDEAAAQQAADDYNAGTLATA